MEQAKFYNILDISVSNNIDKGNKTKECYKKDIVYGDTLAFVGDLLNGITQSNYIGERKFDIVIVDEADSAFIDQSSHLSLISRPIPSFEYLEPILIAIWNKLHVINRGFVYLKEEGKLLWLDGSYRYENGILTLLDENSIKYEITNRFDFTKNLLTEALQEFISKNYEKVFIPTHLNEFVKNQQENWVYSAILANDFYVLGKDYTITIDGNGIQRISPIDSHNTGTIQTKTTWSNGLQQFIQIKHGIKIKAESISSNFMSNMRFFKKYGDNIYGLTGTLGSDSEKTLLYNIYGVDFVHIPTFKPKNFIELPPIITEGQSEWLQEIISSVKKQTSKNRAVLIVAETILQAQEIAQELLLGDFSENKIRLYTRDDNNEKNAIRNKLDSGDVIVATNLAGRGTDIDTTAKLEENGGLHVCVTFLPDNLRVELQAYGRTSRQGNSGTAELIFDKDHEIRQLRHAYPWYNGTSADELIKWRNLGESERLLQDDVSKLDIINLKDELYAEFIKMIDMLKKRPGFGEYYTAKTNNNYDITQIEDLWGEWLISQKNLLEYHINEKITDQNKLDYKQKNQEIRKQLFLNFEKFKVHILKEYNDYNVIKNPVYLVKKGVGKLSVDEIDKAIAIDDMYSYSAHYAKAYVIIKTDGKQKQEAVNSLAIAKEKILNFMIPLLESMNYMIGIHENIGSKNDIIRQNSNKILLLTKQAEFINKSISIIIKSTGEELLNIKSLISFKEIVNGDQSQEDEINEIESISGLDGFFEVGTYVPEPENSGWFGTLFSFVVGIAQIFVGVAVAFGSGGFALSFGVGMIIEGVSDILSSVKAVIEGKPINIEEYFKEKGMSYAINIIASGIISVKEVVTKGITHGAKEITQETVKKTALEKAVTENGKKELINAAIKEELVHQGIVKGLGYAANIVLGNVLDDHKTEINQNVRNEINSMLEKHKDDLHKLLSFDRLEHNSNNQNFLYTKALKILKHYENKYRTIALTIAKGVAAKLNPVVGIGIKLADIAISIDKISEVTGEFCQEFRNFISNIANKIPQNDALLEKTFFHSFKKDEISNILLIFNNENIIPNHKLVQNGCNNVESLDFGSLADNKYVIQALCLNIQKVIQADYTSSIENVKNSLTATLSNSIIRMINNELVNPVSSLASGWAGDKIFANMQEAKQKVIDDAKLKGGKKFIYPGSQTEEAYAQPANDNKEHIDTQIESPKSNDPQIKQLAKKLLINNGGLVDADLLSKELSRKIIVYKDGKYQKSFDDDGKKYSSKPLKVNYDSATKQWSSHIPAHNECGPPAPGSIYEAIGKQVNYDEHNLRQKTSDYILTHPTIAKEIIANYKVDDVPFLNGKQYVVKKSDNLAKIAAKYGKNLDEVIKANPHLKNPNLIQPGQKINIPASNYDATANMCKFSDNQINNFDDFVNSIKNKEVASKNYCSIGEDKKTIDIGLEYNKLSKEEKFEIQKNLALTRELENAISKNPTKQEKGILEGKLKYIADKASNYLKRYEQYENSHPIKAKAALISGLVLAKGLTGAAIAGVSTGGVGIIPGFIAGVGKGSVDEIKGAAIGFAIGDDIGAFINKGIEEYSPSIIKLDSTLSPQDAAMLSSLALAAMLSSSEFISFAKSLKSVDFAGVKINNGKVEGFNYFKADSGVENGYKKSKVDESDVFKKKLDGEINNQDIVTDLSLENLPGPQLSKKHIKNFMYNEHNNRLLKEDETFYRYHGINNRLGRKEIYVTNEKFSSEKELRNKLAIEDNWGIEITKVTELRVPKGEWISEGIVGPQKNYQGGGYQAILSNVPKSWVIKTEKAFKK